MTLALWVLAVLLVVAGAAGTVLPGLPGTPLVFLGLLAGAAAGGFERVGVPTLILLGGLTLVAVAVDALATWFGVRVAGAGKAALVGAGLGALAGLFFGIPGLLLGPFVGALAGELIAGESWKKALRSGAGAFAGFLLGAVLKIALTLAMIGVFITGWLF